MDPNQIPEPTDNNTKTTFTPPEAWQSDQNPMSVSPTPEPLFPSQPTNPEPISPQSTVEISPTPPLPATETPSSSKKSNVFLRYSLIGLALILLGILIGVLAARFLPTSGTANTPTPTIAVSTTSTPTLDPTANWKTYTNQNPSFSFKYPGDVFAYEDISQKNILFWANEAGGSPETMDSNAVWMSLNIHTNFDNTELSKYTADKWVISHLPTKGAPTSRSFSASYLKGKIVYILVMDSQTDETIAKYENIFNQILSTFKFIEPTSPVELKTEVENWSSYVKSTTKLSWDSCDKEPSNSSDLKMTMATLPISTKEINGVKLAITPKISFTSSDIAEFVLCEAGAYRPIFVSGEYILWVRPCSTGIAPENSKCENTLSQIEALYK